MSLLIHRKGPHYKYYNSGCVREIVIAYSDIRTNTANSLCEHNAGV